MTSSWQNDLTHQQLQSLGNSEQTIVLPIDWPTILETGRDPPKNPHAVRQYLANVVHKLNYHFGVVMTGPDIGKIQVTRKSRNNSGQDTVILSVWRCEQLFPQKITLRWSENGSQRMLFKSAFDIWHSSSSRREIRPKFKIKHPVYLWLRHQIGLPNECAILKFGSLNYRKPLLDSFLATVKNPADWHPKRFWQALYSILPFSRPATNRRIRLKGAGAVYIPPKDDAIELLGEFVATNQATLRF